MADEQWALDGQGTELFAGIPVSDFDRALDWYRRFFGREPAFFPNDVEAVWAIGPQRWFYIIVDAKRAGGAVQTLICRDLEPLIESLSARGIDYVAEELPAESVRKVMYNDPDGNEIGLGRVPAA